MQIWSDLTTRMSYWLALRHLYIGLILFTCKQQVIGTTSIINFTQCILIGHFSKVVIPVWCPAYLLLLWIQRRRSQRYLTTPQRGLRTLLVEYISTPCRSPLHKGWEESGQGWQYYWWWIFNRTKQGISFDSKLFDCLQY